MLQYIDWKQRGQIRSVGSPNICVMNFKDEIEKSKAFLPENLILI